jgi:hypothetical protein
VHCLVAWRPERRPGSPFLASGRQALVGQEGSGEVLKQALGLDNRRPCGLLLLPRLGLRHLLHPEA